MRKILIVVMAMVTMLWFTTPTNALPLESRDNGNMYYDPNLNITWLTNTVLSGIVTWNTAMTWVNTLVYDGYSGWRLPTTPGTIFGVTNQGEMGYLYYTELGNPSGGPLTYRGPFSNLQSYWYWTSLVYTPAPSFAWDFSPYDGTQDVSVKVTDYYGWAVQTGDIAAPVPPPPVPGAGGVPEPTTMLLLGSGLIGLWGLRRKFRK